MRCRTRLCGWTRRAGWNGRSRRRKTRPDGIGFVDARPTPPEPTARLPPSVARQEEAPARRHRPAETRSEGRRLVLDPGAKAAVVLVAVAPGLALCRRADQVGLGDWHGRDGHLQLPDCARRIAASLRPGSRVRRGFARVPV